ncbi:cytochrome b [Roseospirillum parvum]|uniref:Cytochrome b n=1 Tax=Roseospirillum parvum TaxID=83401 RepID=A0A1G7WF98_9PROT|nr:cytochrome b/b6 [Roseospirillum parvum]SDG70588.1 ubiquinol-cytochrome c reductase cytochrome b/c1 subunit/ubiquinol-cytochrome c reductase cytochrome b subunit [Roseospirillum parvum]
MSAMMDNKIVKWVDSRLPIFSLMDEHGIEYPTPKNLNYWWNFGSLAAFVLIVMVATGIFLAMHYVPHGDMAFASIERLMREVDYGWLLRYAHANGASMFFLVVYIHIFRGLYYGSYAKPRELLWIIGVVIMLAMMATAFMGYVLPWGQMSFWAAKVITSMFSAVPIFGEDLVVWIWGGFSVGSPTLTRFFSLHYLLPFLILALVFLHVWALHTTKSNNPLGIDIKGPQDTIPFHPYYTIKDLYGIGVLMMLFMGFVFFAPNYLGHPDNYVPANPMVTPPHIVPEWYFLPFYTVLRAIDNKLLGVIAMFASVLILIAVPWLDRSKVRSLSFRPIMKIFFWLFVLDTLILGYIGAMPAEGIWIPLGQASTAYYFLHFLVILPLVSMYEKPRPLPESISNPVVKDTQDQAAATEAK